MAYLNSKHYRNDRLEILRQALGDKLAQKETRRAEIEQLQHEIETLQDEVFNLENYK